MLPPGCLTHCGSFWMAGSRLGRDLSVSSLWPDSHNFSVCFNSMPYRCTRRIRRRFEIMPGVAVLFLVAAHLCTSSATSAPVHSREANPEQEGGCDCGKLQKDVECLQRCADTASSPVSELRRDQRNTTTAGNQSTLPSQDEVNQGDNAEQELIQDEESERIASGRCVEGPDAVLGATPCNTKSTQSSCLRDESCIWRFDNDTCTCTFRVS